MESMAAGVGDCELVGVYWELPGSIPVMERKGRRGRPARNAGGARGCAERRRDAAARARVSGAHREEERERGGKALGFSGGGWVLVGVGGGEGRHHASWRQRRWRQRQGSS
jgi:hypothetical protein